MNCAKSSVTLDQLIADLTAIRAEHGLGAMPVGFFCAKGPYSDGKSHMIEHKLLFASKLETPLGEPFFGFVLSGAEKDLGIATQLA